MVQRPEVPEAWVDRLQEVLGGLPGCHRAAAWTGVRWRVGQATVAHVFGGEDQLFPIAFGPLTDTAGRPDVRLTGDGPTRRLVPCGDWSTA